MKIKLIKKYWDDRYEYHITTPAKDVNQNPYDYTAKRIYREDKLPKDERGNKLGVMGNIIPMESDEEFEERANKIFEDFIQKEKNKKEDIVLKEVDV